MDLLVPKKNLSIRKRLKGDEATTFACFDENRMTFGVSD
jgi:hypothetical protein